MSEHKDLENDLATQLPDLYPNSETSRNYQLLQPVALYLDRTDTNIEDVDLVSTMQDQMAADKVIPKGQTQLVRPEEERFYNTLTVNGTLIINGRVTAINVEVNGSLQIDNGDLMLNDGFVRDRLEELGKLVDVPPEEDETNEHYRARLISEFSLLTSEGTISDVLNAFATIFNVSTEKVDYKEPVAGENGTMSVTLPEAAFETSELSRSEASDIIEKLAPASYRLTGLSVGTFTYITPEEYDSGTHDATLGYDGLDANGDPNDNGGTYSGAI